MKKMFLISSCCLWAAAVFAGGLDLEFFGYKVCNVGFDVNPFSRDDGRSARVYVPACSPQYYTLPPAPAVTGGVNAANRSRNEKRSIIVKDSSNVTIVNHESLQSSHPVYAPTVRAVYPAVQYYTYPAVQYYTYPAAYTYCSYPGYYYHRPYYHRWWY